MNPDLNPNLAETKVSIISQGLDLSVVVKYQGWWYSTVKYLFKGQCTVICYVKVTDAC